MVKVVRCHLRDNNVAFHGSGHVEFNVLNSVITKNKIGYQQTYYGNDSMIINSTFADNDEDIFYESGYTRSKLKIVNTILRGTVGGANFVYLSYCNYVPANMGTNVVLLGGNQTGDALFVDQANGDYHLQSGSPCIDAGDPNAFYNDYDGTYSNIGYTGGSNLTVNTDRFDFGYVALGKTKELPLVIHNRRNDAVVLSHFEISDPQSSITTPFPITIAANSDATINVVYTPTTKGIYLADITIYSDDLSGATYAEFPSTGYGIQYSDAVIQVPSEAPTIQAAVDVASNGDTIILAAGTYHENTIIITKPLTIVGKDGPENTFIDGNGKTPITLEVIGSEIRGISFKNSQYGIAVGLGSDILAHIIDCHFIDNVIGILGSGHVSFNVLNSIFIRNEIGIYQQYYGNDSLIVNSTFVDNEKDVLFTPSYGTISKLDAINTIFTGEIISADYNYIYLNYCSYDPTKIGANVVIQTGNLTGDPLFVDPANGDYHLQSGSPCVDAGDPSYDYSKEPFPNGNRINMGAYGGTPEATPSPKGLSRDELVLDYGAAYGLWHYDQPGGWSQLHPVVPQQIVVVDIDNDGQDEFAAAFPGGGLYTYDRQNAPANRWTPIHPLVPNAMIKFNNGLVADWGDGGLWTWTQAGGWQPVHPIAPARMWAVDIDNDQVDELVLDYAPGGLYSYDPVNGWDQIHPLVPDTMIKFNNGLAADWGAGGLYTWTQAGGWQPVHPVAPARMWAVDIDDDQVDELVLDYSPGGLYSYDPDNGWDQIHPLVPDAMIKFNNGLAADWGAGGLYTWTQAGGWQPLHPMAPARMWAVDLDDDQVDELVLDYAPGGLYSYNPVTQGWSLLHPIVPNDLIPANLSE